MSTFKTLPDVIKEIEYWLRLATFLHEPLKNALLHVLHNISNDPRYVGLPSDPTILYHKLHRHHINIINQLKKKKILSQEQYEKLFPPNQTKTHSSNFDITLIVLLIRNCTTLPAPKGGWSIVSLPSSDESISANVVRAREWRNFLQHTNPSEIDQVLFKAKWQEGVDIITSLGFVFDTESLLQESLDPKNQKVLKSLDLYLDLLRKNVIDLQNDNKTTQQAFTEILNEQEDLRNLVGNLQRELKAGKAIKRKQDAQELGELVLPDVLAKVSRMIGEDWKALAREIELEKGETTKLENKSGTCSRVEMMTECFDLKNNKITWKKLKNCLHIIQREDIVDVIQAESLITHALRDASLKLRKLYIDELIDWLIEQPFRVNGTRVFDAVPREQAYVELAILQAEELDHLWSNIDRDFHLQQQQFERTSIKMDEILGFTDKFVVIRGIAGIGKSTMVDSFVLKWAKSQILSSSISQNINFLFKLTCRDLNTTQEFQSVSEMLKLKFPTIFREISVADLEEISHQVLVLLDGIDELKEISAFKDSSHEHSPRAAVIRDLLWSRSQHLSGHRTIVCGRPEACQYIASSFSPFVSLKMIEICGFNTKSIEQFIDFFYRHDNQQSQLVKDKIKESENLTVMASIPIYLWVICNIFQENIITGTINTTTELCAYSFLLFIRNHLKVIRKTDYMPLVDLCSDYEVLSMTKALAELSYITLKESKVVFSDKEIASVKPRMKLEDTGFITKHLYSDTEGYMYQFKHLVLQEFLSALWCYLNYDFKCEQVFPLISGLFGLENVTKGSVLSQWLKNLRKQHMEMQHWADYLKNQLRSIKNFQKQLSGRTIEFLQGNRIVISSTQSSLLSAIYEYQNKVFLAKQFQEKRSIIIKNLSFQHDIRNAIYFIDILQTKTIESISIDNFNNNKLPDNISKIFELFFGGKNNEKVVGIKGGDEMGISTEVFTEDGKIFRKINVILSTASKVSSNASTPASVIVATTALRSTTTSTTTTALVPTSTTLPPASRTATETPLSSLKAEAISSLVTAATTTTTASTTPLELECHEATVTGTSIDADMYCHNDLITLLCYSANKVVIDFSVSHLYPRLKDLVQKIGRTINIELVQNSQYHRKFSVIDRKALTTMKIEILRDNTQNNFIYVLSQYLNLKNCQLNDSVVADVSKQICNCAYVALGRMDRVSPEGVKTLSDEIKKSQAMNICCLKILNLSRCGLTSMHLTKLTQQLMSVQEVILKDNRLDISSIQTLVNALKQGNHVSLNLLSLQACWLTPDSFPLLVQLLQNIDHLDVSRNILSPVPISSGVNLQETFSNIGKNKTLSLANCNLKDTDVLHLLPLLVNIKSLSLSRNTELTYETTSAFSNYLKEAAKQKTAYNLQRLDLSFCSKASYEGLLPCISYLDELSFRYNMISPEQMTKTSDFILKRSKPVDTLDLSSRILTDDHILNLSPAFKNIKHLHLRFAFGLSTRVIKSIKISSVTETLDFSSSASFDEGLLPELLEKCVKAKNVYFSGDRFTTEVVEKLASELYPKKNNFLRSLSLTNCKLNDRSITPLIPCLPFIQDIGLKANDFSDKKVRQIIRHIGEVIDSNHPKMQFITMRINKLIVKLKGCELSSMSFAQTFP